MSNLGGHDALFETIAQSPLAMVISNPRRPDNPLEAVNAAFLAMTGYREVEVVGRNCRFLAGPRPEQPGTQSLREAIAQQKSAVTEIVNYRSDGSAFRNGVMIAPLFDQNGNLAWYLGSQVDLGAPEASGLGNRQAASAAQIDILSVRQRQVLSLVARGLLNKQIAFELGISEKTVKMHRALMLERLGVSTSAEAIRMAVEAGL